MAELGYNPGTPGAFTSPIASGTTTQYIGGSQFTMTENGTASKITAYLDYTTASRQTPKYTTKCAIYVWDGTSFTHDLVDETESHVFGYGAGVEGPANDGWQDFDFASGVSLTSGTTYFIVCWGLIENSTTSALTLRLTNSVSGVDYANDSQSWGAWPDPHSATVDLSNYACNIYATYTAATGGPPTGSLALMGVGK